MAWPIHPLKPADRGYNEIDKRPLNCEADEKENEFVLDAKDICYLINSAPISIPELVVKDRGGGVMI